MGKICVEVTKGSSLIEVYFQIAGDRRNLLGLSRTRTKRYSRDRCHKGVMQHIASSVSKDGCQSRGENSCQTLELFWLRLLCTSICSHSKFVFAPTTLSDSLAQADGIQVLCAILKFSTCCHSQMHPGTTGKPKVDQKRSWCFKTNSKCLPSFSNDEKA